MKVLKKVLFIILIFMLVLLNLKELIVVNSETKNFYDNIIVNETFSGNKNIINQDANDELDNNTNGEYEDNAEILFENIVENEKETEATDENEYEYEYEYEVEDETEDEELDSRNSFSASEEQFEINPAKITLNINNNKHSSKLKQKLEVVGNSNKDIKWRSSDSTIASVSNDGEVTALQAGKAIITAENNKKKATCEVTVVVEKPITEKQHDFEMLIMWNRHD